MSSIRWHSIGSGPSGNIARINHVLESMPKQLAEAQTKLETVDRQLETAKAERDKPFAQEAELAEKPEPRASQREKLEKFKAQADVTQKQADGKEKRQNIYCKSG